MTDALIIFSRASSSGISIVLSSCEFFSTTVEAEEGGTTADVPFGLSSSLREDI
jgi:hypothetical protein